ncbi:MAG: helix-turn-helix transcriptional regulator [Candidatus Eremiobacteraeota bacterium]|nr:helix-turn-helix transcriptional regulator [Candidatus Eremiobacteraeota bacterium]
MHPAHVSRWERGHMQPGSSTLARLAEVFEVSVDELVSSQEEEPSTRQRPSTAEDISASPAVT